MLPEKHVIFSFFLASSILCLVTTQTFSWFASCKDVIGVDYINEDRFKGVWYEYARSPRDAEDDSRCNTFIIHLPIRGLWPTTRLQINKGFFWDSEGNYTANSTIDGSGKGETPDDFMYTILATDYDNYTVVYACKDTFLDLGKEEELWILTRDRFPKCQTILDSYNVVLSYGLPLVNVKKTNQTDCPENWDTNSNFIQDIFNFRG